MVATQLLVPLGQAGQAQRKPDLHCDPQKSQPLRATFQFIQPFRV